MISRKSKASITEGAEFHGGYKDLLLRDLIQECRVRDADALLVLFQDNVRGSNGCEGALLTGDLDDLSYL